MDIDKLLTYIEQNIKEDISLVDIAGVVHYSPRQVYYMIKEATGMPVMSYIRYRRLVNAAAEIAQGRKLIDVAVDYGQLEVSTTWVPKLLKWNLCKRVFRET